MKVLFAAPTPPPVHGGTIMAQEIVNADIDDYELVHFDTSRSGDLEDLGKFNLGGIFKVLSQAFGFQAMILREQPDIVHLPLAQNTTGFLKFSLFAGISKLNGCQIVSRLGGAEFSSFFNRKSPIFQSLINSVTGWIDTLIVRGTKIKKELEKFNFKSIEVLPISMSQANIPDNEQNFYRDDEYNIIFLNSNLSKAKGVFLVLDAIEKLIAQSNDFHLSLAGKMMEEEKNILKYTMKRSQKEVLKERLASPELKDYVSYEGFLGQEEKWRSFFNADLFILASYSEAFPFSVLEAMMTKTPVVATEVGGLVDHFKDGEHIFYFDKGDAEDLSRTIEFVKNNPNLAQKVTASAHEYVTDNLTIDRYIRKLTDIYTRVLN